MLTKAKIINFGSYREQQLEQMKRDLKLHLPLQTLSFCANYYLTQAKRDPFIEEIRMLDHLFLRAQTTLSFVAPTELLTNCDFVAETYADMMKKRHELRPDAKTPCSFAEALNLATLYLKRAGKESEFPNTLFSLEDLKNVRRAQLASNFIASPSSAIGLRTVHREKALPETGDLFVLLRSGDELIPTSYQKSLANLLDSPTATQHLSAARRVSEKGLLYEILQLTGSARIDLKCLSLSGEPLSLTMLADAYAGDCLIRISPKFYPAFSKAAKEAGVRATVFAAAMNGSRLLFTEGKVPLFELESGFLRAVFPAFRASIKINGEELAPSAPILHTPKTTSVCTYLTSEQNVAVHTVSHRGILSSAASSQPEGGFFKAALETLLTSVLTLAAAGCDYRELRAAVGLSLPTKETDSVHLGEAMASILGIYRLQAELGLPLAAAQIFADNDIEHPQISTFCMAKKSAGCDRLVAEGDRIYCIAPKLQKNGLPDFAALRKLLAELTKLHKNGVVKSARVVCRESITDVIRKMSTDSLTCLYDGHVVVADDYMDLAIVIESTEKLAFARVGRVTKKMNPAKPSVEKVLPAAASLLSLQEAKIILLSHPNDLSAELLADRCRESGAEVLPLSIRAEDLEQRLSRALLEAQTLIVCAKDSIPHTSKTEFALDTFRRAGGRILLVGDGAHQKDLGGFALPEGISPKMLEQICKVEND